MPVNSPESVSSEALREEDERAEALHAERAARWNVWDEIDVIKRRRYVNSYSGAHIHEAIASVFRGAYKVTHQVQSTLYGIQVMQGRRYAIFGTPEEGEEQIAMRLLGQVPERGPGVLHRQWNRTAFASFLGLGK